jgi:hypothetical protein
MPQPPGKATGDRGTSGHGFALIVAVFSLAGCLCCGPLAVGLGASEVRARQFEAPIYPGSTQISHWRGGVPDKVWEEMVYHTPDSLALVVAYMDQRMPGFNKWSDPALPGPRYGNGNGRSIRSPLGWLASLLGCSTGVPKVSVIIAQSVENATITEITVSYHWPDP